MSYSVSIREAERSLASHFAKLRDSRTGPIFFIEHGLSEPDSRKLRDFVSQAARYRLIQSGWWREYPLPLLVTATEVGYRYRGTGTDFWPKLESKLKIDIGAAARQQVRELFVSCSEWYRGAKPADTPWTTNFCLIAWPITHALVPVEFHRQLAAALANLRLSAYSLDNEDLHAAVRIAAGQPSARFHTFLEDASLAVPVIRALLGEGNGEISPGSIDRIAKDLESDSDAHQNIKIAKQVQRRLQSRKSRANKTIELVEPEAVKGVLQLRVREGDRIGVEALFPRREGPETDRLRRTLRRRRFAPKLWGLTSQVPSERLFSGVPFPINLRSLPDIGAPLFPGLRELGIENDLVITLNSFQLNFELPLLFAANGERNLARMVRGFDISAYREYWLLGKQGTLESFTGIVQFKINEPFVCYRVNPLQSGVQEVLRGLGYTVRHGVSVSIAGAPTIDEHDGLSRFNVGDERIVVPRWRHSAETFVEFGGKTVELNDDLVRVRTGEGDNTLSIYSRGTLWQDQFEGVPAAATTAKHPVCWFELSADEMTVQALLAGNISFGVHGPAPLEGLTITLELEAGGRRSGVSTSLDPLPHMFLAEDEIWLSLLNPATRARLLEDPSPVLHARVDSLAAESWTLEQRIRPCWWRGSPSSLVLESELGPLDYGAIPISTPASQPVPAEHGAGSDAVLLAPLRPDKSVLGPAASFVTFCVAPERTTLSLPRIESPRLCRSRRGRSGSMGVEDLVEAWFRWSLAEADSLTAQIRKAQASSTLDRWLAELSCGEVWARRETYINAGFRDPWKLFADECRKSRLGLDDFVELGERDEVQVVRYAEAEIRRTQPQLWVRVGPLPHLDNDTRRSLLDDDEYAVLDAAFEGGYQKLASRYRRAGNVRLARKIEQADPGAGPDQWDPVLDAVRSKWELHELAELLYPTDTAQWLTTLDLTLMALNDIADELHRWATASRNALAADVPAHQALMAVLAIWIAPSTAVSLDWRGALDTLVADRSLSRAVRYLALRARSARIEFESK